MVCEHDSEITCKLVKLHIDISARGQTLQDPRGLNFCADFHNLRFSINLRDLRCYFQTVEEYFLSPDSVLIIKCIKQKREDAAVESLRSIEQECKQKKETTETNDPAF